MKNRYNTMIYPFDMEAIPLIRNNEVISDYNILYAVAPNGWGFTNKDVGSIDGGNPIGIIVNSDFDDTLKKCDTVFFTNFNKKLDINQFIYPKIIKACKNEKNIICTVELELDKINNIREICNKNNKVFKYFVNKNDNVNKPEVEEIYEINTPIVFITGLTEMSHKFEIQLSLRKHLNNMGYKISQIGSREYCELMGFHSFPNFMYSSKFTEYEKVTLFNHYIRNIELTEKPDIILIGIPGGTMPFNRKITNKFGILAYQISQAIVPDVVVMSILCKDNDTEGFLKLLSNSHKFKFGYEIDCYNISSTKLNPNDTERERQLQYVTTDFEFINKNKRHYCNIDKPLYNIMDKSDSQNMANFIIEKLAEYGDAESI
ncbi:TIGR04066 family peptide maturation system protein [Clostridium botulinum]|uniref:TIGR04066 family peptide maturation system protein n=1 Tax=Clostridium botulinum TaxID=1491 RepID=UPI0014009D68|nr:TIGR04066 family peptide maturation system protein [Clostridium botulinum]MBY6914835.1 TIGR04066 family peptide maturation system protein [Clostridium botulinum]NFO38857.1 TIGR04066 family peptide maturation system protein [Clostridium botulinum]NFQ39704.1 TIGR04066 family peptide maturation system protein [Clostridium botulinum]